MITPLWDHPEYREAEDKLHALKAQLEKLHEDLRTVMPTLDRVARAKELLATGTLQPIPTPADAVPIKAHIAIVKEAVKIQEQVVDDVRRRLNDAVCKDNEREFKQLLKQRVLAMIDLFKMCRAESELRGNIEAAGYTITIPAACRHFFNAGEGDVYATLQSGLETGVIAGDDPILDDQVLQADVVEMLSKERKEAIERAKRRGKPAPPPPAIVKAPPKPKRRDWATCPQCAQETRFKGYKGGKVACGVCKTRFTPNIEPFEAPAAPARPPELVGAAE